MRKYRHVLANAFSINMIRELIPQANKRYPADVGFPISFKEVPASDVPKDCISVVGHADTAAILTNLLGFNVPCNRETFNMADCLELYVAQYNGPRLPEGTTELPDGANFTFYLVQMVGFNYDDGGYVDCDAITAETFENENMN